MNSEEVKIEAKKLKELSKKYGYDIKHSHALEIVSQLKNKENWHLSKLKDPNFIKTGITSLDKDLGGGLKKGTLTTIIGRTNSGKSTLAKSIASNSLREGHNVLHINLEGGLFCKDSYYANLSSVRFGNFCRKELTTKDLNKIKKSKEKYEDKLRIIQLRGFNQKVEEVYSLCVSEYKDFKFDLLVIDYGQLLSTEDQDTITHEKMVSKIHFLLKKLSKELNVAVMTPAQATFKKNEKLLADDEILSIDYISESYDIVNASDVVLTINISCKQRELGKATINLAKNSKKMKKLYELKTDFPKMNLIK